MLDNFDGQLQELLNGFIHDIDVLKHSKASGVWSAAAKNTQDHDK